MVHKNQTKRHNIQGGDVIPITKLTTAISAWGRSINMHSCVILQPELVRVENKENMYIVHSM